MKVFFDGSREYNIGWCPEHKGTDRQFECTKSITSEIAIKSIENFLDFQLC